MRPAAVSTHAHTEDDSTPPGSRNRGYPYRCRRRRRVHVQTTRSAWNDKCTRYKVVRTLRLTKLNSSPAQPWLRIPPPQPRLRWPWAVRMPRRSLGIVVNQRRRLRRRWSTGRNEGSCSGPDTSTWACWMYGTLAAWCGPHALMGIHVRGAWPPREKRTAAEALAFWLSLLA